jgi:selT/selW/selH-like putative selenoprotein
MASSTRWVLLLLLAATTGAFMSPLRQNRPRRRDAVSLKSLESAGGEHISIEYCTGCRWMLRAAWMSQELLTTFQQELDSVTLIPSRPPASGGVFVSIFLSLMGEMLLAQ